MLALLHKHPLTTFIMSIPIIFFPFNLHTIFENSTKKKYWEDERLYNINDRCNFYSQSINSQQLICLWLMEEVEACKEEGNSTHWWCSSLNSAGWSPWTAKSPQTRRSRTKSERQWRERRCRLHKESPQHKSGMRKSCPSAGLSAKQLSLLSSDLMAVSPCFPLLSLPFFFFSVFEGFSENRLLQTHSEAFISTLTYQLLSIYNHMKARKPTSGISSFLSFIFYFSGDDDQRTRNYGPSTTWTEEWKFKGCQLQPSSERVQMHSFKLRTAFIFLQLQKINEILHHVSVSRTKKRTTYGWLLKNIIIR